MTHGKIQRTGIDLDFVDLQMNGRNGAGEKSMKQWLVYLGSQEIFAGLSGPR
jgi:hypothetical protein